MKCYSVHEIREAGGGEQLIAELERRVLPGSALITAREIRESMRRILPEGKCLQCGAAFHGEDPPAEYILRDILEHRGN